MQVQHTSEAEFIASVLDPLPDTVRADWVSSVGQWLAQYRRGVVEPIPTPRLAGDSAVVESEGGGAPGEDETRQNESETHKPKAALAGDWPHEGPRLCPAEIAILQALANLAEGERLRERGLATKTGYASIRKYLGPSGPLVGYWGLDNKGGYYIDEEDRDRVRQAFP